MKDVPKSLQGQMIDADDGMQIEEVPEDQYYETCKGCGKKFDRREQNQIDAHETCLKADDQGSPL